MTLCIEGLEQTHSNPQTQNRPFDRRLTVAEIEAALHALLTAIEVEEDRRLKLPRKPGHFRLLSVRELASIEPAVWKVEDLSADPIGRSCREQIKALGKLLFKVTGSTDAMLGTLERVADLNPARTGSRYDIMDKWWSGVGDGTDIWTS